MRRISFLTVLVLLTFAGTAACARANTILHLTADHIAFYYDRFLVEADGNVRVQTSDGFSASGDAFSMDLKLNRFLVAGHVTLRYGNEQASGAAISDFLDFNRIYFVPVTSEPDRWTFLNGDLAHPVKGRTMPGDTFAFPDVSETPSLTATQATIGTKSYARFSGATTYLAGVGVPLGSFVVNFSPNQYFAQNSLTGANFDATWNFAGNNNSLSAAHLRYDTHNYAYLAFEQHFVGQHEYAIFSVNPLTKSARFFNLSAYEKLGERFQIQTFTQFYIDQGVLLSAPPLAVTQTTFVNATQAFPHSYLQLSSNFTNYNLIGPGAFNSNNTVGAGSLSHPSQMQLTDTSFQNRIAKLPLYEQTYVGYGFNHDSVGPNQYGTPIPPSQSGLQSFGGTAYKTIWNTVFGFNLFVPSVKIGSRDNPYKAYFLNATLNKQRQWNSLPHHIDNTTTTFSLSRQFSRPVNSYLSYQIMNTGDYYLQGGYQPCTPNVNNPLACPPSLTSFRGVSTLRTVTLGVNYDPNPEFNASLIGRHHDDFPIPVPGVFPLPLTNVIGQPLYNNYLGQPPNDLTGDVRFKILPHMVLDVQRTYYFNFGNIRWSPYFIVQVLPQ